MAFRQFRSQHAVGQVLERITVTVPEKVGCTFFLLFSFFFTHFSTTHRLLARWVTIRLEHADHYMHYL